MAADLKADAARSFRPGRVLADRRCGRESGQRNRCCRYRPIRDLVPADRTQCQMDREDRQRTRPSRRPADRSAAEPGCARPPLSAANTSPFGATRMRRGDFSPEANRLTSKPFGTCRLLRVGARDSSDEIWCRRSGIGSRQVRWRDKTSRSRTVSMPIAECCLALKCGPLVWAGAPLAGAEKERHARGGNNRRDRMRHRALLANVPAPPLREQAEVGRVPL